MRIFKNTLGDFLYLIKHNFSAKGFTLCKLSIQINNFYKLIFFQIFYKTYHIFYYRWSLFWFIELEMKQQLEINMFSEKHTTFFVAKYIKEAT